MMYLLDTNVISEQRKGERTNIGVKNFFQQLDMEQKEVFLSVISVGELRRGIDLIAYRGDNRQADMLETWLRIIISNYKDNILDFDVEMSQLWGRIRVPNYENELDKQIAATAIIYDLTLVTRNTKDFIKTGVKVVNPFI